MDLIGFNIDMPGSDPLQVETRSVVTALYGRNGAGKSLILDACRKAVGVTPERPERLDAVRTSVLVRFRGIDFTVEQPADGDAHLLWRWLVPEDDRDHRSLHSALLRAEVRTPAPGTRLARALQQTTGTADVEAAAVAHLRTCAELGVFGHDGQEAWLTFRHCDLPQPMQDLDDEIHAWLHRFSDRIPLAEDKKPWVAARDILRHLRTGRLSLQDLANDWSEETPSLPELLVDVEEMEALLNWFMPDLRHDGEAHPSRSREFASLGTAPRPVRSVTAGPGEAPDDLAAAHFARLAMGSKNDDPWLTGGVDPIEVRLDLDLALATWGADATRLLGEFLERSPVLSCRLRGSDHILTGEPGGLLHWVATTDEGVDLPLDHLSDGYLRWARFAINRTLGPAPHGGPTDSNWMVEVVLRQHDPFTAQRELDANHGWTGEEGLTIELIDEPESALHVTAQHRVARALHQLADHVLIATHSPVFLNHFDDIIHVSRDGTGISVAPLKPGNRAAFQEAAADELGLTVAELVQLTRVIVLVEGDHDALVIRALLSDDLRSARAHVVRMRGARRLASIAEARWMFDLTTASIVVVVDSLRHDEIGAPLEQAQEQARRGDTRAAKATLARALKRRPDATHEERLAIELAHAALEGGRMERLHIRGLARADILEYLPVTAFADEERSWDELFATYQSQEQGRVSGYRYKEWLRNNGLAVHFDGIVAALRAVGSGSRPLDVPARRELDELGAAIRTLGVAP